MDHLYDGLLWYIAFIFSVILHEAAHALAALFLEDETAYAGGQVSLDPVPHIRREPFGMVLVPLVSYAIGGWMMGWGSAPYNYYWAQRFPKRSALMALAGPLANLLLVIVAAVLIHFGIYLGMFYAPESITFGKVVGVHGDGIMVTLGTLLSIFFSLNLVLFFFNLLPLPPLDGSGILPLFLNDDTARRYMDVIHNSAFMIFGLLLAWFLFDEIFRPIHIVVINLLYPGMGYH